MALRARVRHKVMSHLLINTVALFNELGSLGAGVVKFAALGCNGLVDGGEQGCFLVSASFLHF
jgi:hypothetical protein